MNCSRAERMILLSQTDELSGMAAARLRRHLAACGRCRAYGEDVLRLASAAHAALPEGEPGNAVTARIRERAVAGLSRKSNVLFWPGIGFIGRYGRLAAACAASALLLAGAWVVSTRETRHRNERVAGVSALMAILSEEQSEAAEHFDRADKGDLKALAKQLLMFEGMGFGEEENLEEDFIPLDERQTITPQEHSAAGLRMRRCA